MRRRLYFTGGLGNNKLTRRNAYIESLNVCIFCSTYRMSEGKYLERMMVIRFVCVCVVARALCARWSEVCQICGGMKEARAHATYRAQRVRICKIYKFIPLHHQVISFFIYIYIDDGWRR